MAQAALSHLAGAIQPSGDLTQEWVSVRSARGLWRGR